MRVGGRAAKGDVQRDKAKLFPELAAREKGAKRSRKKPLTPRTQGGSAGGVPPTK